MGDGGAAEGDVLVLAGVVACVDGAPFADFEAVVFEVADGAGGVGAEARGQSRVKCPGFSQL